MPLLMNETEVMFSACRNYSAIKENDSKGKISGLLDFVLWHMLSCLPPKDSMATSILS